MRTSGGYPARTVVYISLLFTLLAIPFVEMLRRELKRRGIRIRLGGRGWFMGFAGKIQDEPHSAGRPSRAC